MNALRVDFACNDPDNGLFAHAVSQIEVSHLGPVLELETYWQPRRFLLTETGFSLAGKRWPTVASKEWLGNWCWNAYWLEIPVAVDFFAWLHGRQLFQVSCGSSRLFTRWKDSQRFDAGSRELFRAVFERVAARQGGRA